MSTHIRLIAESNDMEEGDYSGFPTKVIMEGEVLGINDLLSLVTHFARGIGFAVDLDEIVLGQKETITVDFGEDTLDPADEAEGDEA